MQLGKYFRTSETSGDSALALESRKKSGGAAWYKKAKSSASPTPAVRYYPNLGVMLGMVDQAGLKALRAHARVDEVVGPPVMSLIRPVTIAAKKVVEAEAKFVRSLIRQPEVISALPNRTAESPYIPPKGKRPA